MSKKMLLLALLCLLAAPADAKWLWFGKDEEKGPSPAQQLETFQPPPADAIERYCEPIRREVVLLNGKPAAQRLMLQPKILRLIRKHEQCKAEFMQQEMEYLRHVDIQQPPSLPKLEPASETPPAPAAEAHAPVEPATSGAE